MERAPVGERVQNRSSTSGPGNGALHALTLDANKPEYYVRRGGSAYYARPEEITAVIKGANRHRRFPGSLSPDTRRRGAWRRADAVLRLIRHSMDPRALGRTGCWLSTKSRVGR